MRNFRQVFINCTTAQKAVYIPMELILNKKVCVFLRCLQFLRKSALKRLDRTVHAAWFGVLTHLLAHTLLYTLHFLDVQSEDLKYTRFILVCKTHLACKIYLNNDMCQHPHWSLLPLLSGVTHRSGLLAVSLSARSEMRDRCSGPRREENCIQFCPY
jgi:hypothetical protein